MAVTSVDVRGDSLTVQSNGEHRGLVVITFDNRPPVEQNLRAPNAAAWADLLVNVQAKVEQQVAEQDAQKAVDEDVPISEPKGESTPQQRAVAYLRRAYELGDPYAAYLKFQKFNDYRLAQGWTINQVQQNLAVAGLTETEWTDIRNRYAYLSDAGRVTTMQAYQSVLDGDVWGEESR